MRPFTVETYNVAGQDWMGWDARKDAAHFVSQIQTADIIGYQEWGPGNEEYLWRPGLSFAYGAPAGDTLINTVGFDERRFRAVASDSFWLSDDGTYKKAWGEQRERGATWVRLEEPASGRALLLLNLHLDNVGADARREGMRRALGFVEEQERAHGPSPVVITADANMSVDSPHPRWRAPELQEPYQLLLDAGFRDAWAEAHPDVPRPGTYHGFKGSAYEADEYGTWDTDLIAVRGLDVLDCQVITDSVGGTYPSDHYPVRAVLSWRA